MQISKDTKSLWLGGEETGDSQKCKDVTPSRSEVGGLSCGGGLLMENSGQCCCAFKFLGGSSRMSNRQLGVILAGSRDIGSCHDTDGIWGPGVG